MSFKRRGQAQTVQLPGTRPSQSSPSVNNISTGIPSLDDVLGGGLPLGCVLVVLAPDPNTAYSDLLQRYFIAQGISSGHNVCIVDDNAIDLASNCMWIPNPKKSSEHNQEDEGSVTNSDKNSGVKIAWRYEKMKKFQTSVTHEGSAQNDYCHPLDLTCRIPEQIINVAVDTKLLHCLPVSSTGSTDSMGKIMTRIDGKLSEMEKDVSVPIRLSIPYLASPQWGDLSPSDILRFLHALRARIRQDFSTIPRTSIFITLPSFISQDGWGGSGWLQKLGRLADGCITLRSFSADPALLSMFPSHHGLLNVHSLPAQHTLIPPSDKFSELRGLSAFSSSTTGGGENNLAFKCTRKRFIIETLHLDVEGGVNERRTTAAVTPDIGVHIAAHAPEVQISLNEAVLPEVKSVKKKAKKSVAFQSDRPDLYDF